MKKTFPVSVGTVEELSAHMAPLFDMSSFTLE